MYELIKKELKKKYENCNFCIIETNDFFKILYDDINLLEDEKFSDEVFEICFKILEEDKMWKLTIVYDALKEIPRSEEER